MSIWIDHNKVQYKYYTKEISSDNCLNKNSWLPSHVKNNFVDNLIKTVMHRIEIRNDVCKKYEGSNY